MKLSVNLMQASRQWAERPVDTRFWGLDDMGAALHDSWVRSTEVKAPTTKVRAVEFVGGDGADLAVKGSKGPVKLTHWSMGQLCRYAGAPAEYLRSLPPELAARCINNGMEKREADSVQLLLQRNDETGLDTTLRSVTTDYSRLWNNKLIEAIRPGVEFGWMVPPARPAVDDPRARPATLADIVPGQDGFWGQVRVGQMIAPAGCYASDRDMFVFMVNPNRVIDLDGDAMMRGFFAWNSEVGAGAFKVQMFYLEQVCSNHIVWNAKNVRPIRIVHKGNNFRDVKYQLHRGLKQLADSSTADETAMVHAAKHHVIGENREEVAEILYNNKVVGLTRATIEEAYDAGVRFEHTANSPPNTTWNFVHGLTRYSQTMTHADKRSELDHAAGKLLQIAYKAREGLTPVKA